MTSYDHFWDFDSSTNWYESAHDSSSISETGINSAYDSSGFPGTDSELTHDSSGSHGIDSDHSRLKMLPDFFYSNQLTTQAKNIWFWVDSWFYSWVSYPCLAPRHCFTERAGACPVGMQNRRQCLQATPFTAAGTRARVGASAILHWGLDCSGGRHVSTDQVSAPDMELPQPEPVSNCRDILLTARVELGAPFALPFAPMSIVCKRFSSSIQ